MCCISTASQRLRQNAAGTGVYARVTLQFSRRNWKSGELLSNNLELAQLPYAAAMLDTGWRYGGLKDG